jgi:1-deoxy-D-xylulose-5-phosphate synthase
MLPIPNLTILAPKDGVELDQMLKWAVNANQIVSIRYPRGSVHHLNGSQSNPFEPKKSEILLDSPDHNQRYDITILSAGSMSWPSYEAAVMLQSEGYSVSSINLRTIKPLNKEQIEPFVRKSKFIIVVEEGQAIGGIFYFIINQFSKIDTHLSQWHQIAIPDEFVTHGKQEKLRNHYKLSTKGIYSYISELIKSSIIKK